MPLHAVVAAAARDLSMSAGDGVWPRVVLMEELGRLSCAALTLSFAAHVHMVLPVLDTYGSSEVKDRFLRPGETGAAIFSRSLRRARGEQAVVAREDGGDFVLDGTSTYAANASIADAHCVVAQGPESDVAILMVPATLQGITVDALAGGLGHVRLHGARVPASFLVGHDRTDSARWLARIRRERVLAACGATAAAGRSVEVAEEYSRVRVAFGTSLHGHQAVRLRLAELRAQLEAGRCLNHATGRLSDAAGDDGALSAAAALKAGAIVVHAAEACMELHGARGYEASHEASRLVRNARLLSIALGPDDDLLLDLGFAAGATPRRLAPTVWPFDDTHGPFRAAVHAAVQSEIVPRLAAWSRSERFPVRDALACLERTGYLGAGFSPDHGGLGGDLWQSVVLHEEVAGLGDSALATAVLSHLEVGTRLVADHASPATAARWVPSCLRGATVLGYAATEGEAGSDLAATTTSARKQGDTWVIDGHKKYITNGEQADALCVLVRTGDRAVTSHTLFLVPMSSAGATSAPLRSLGNRGTLGEVWFDGVHVGSDAVLGLEGQGLMLQIRRLAHERAFVAVTLVALADRLLHELTDHERGEVAYLVADVARARQLAYHAVAMVAAGRDARAPAAMAKLIAGRVLRAAADAAAKRNDSTLEADSPAGRAYFDALGFAFAGGTDNMLLEAIAR